MILYQFQSSPPFRSTEPKASAMSFVQSSPIALLSRSSLNRILQTPDVSNKLAFSFLAIGLCLFASFLAEFSELSILSFAASAAIIGERALLFSRSHECHSCSGGGGRLFHRLRNE